MLISKTIDTEMSKKFTSVRFFLIALVVFIHNDNIEKDIVISTELPNYFKILREFIGTGIASIAVPMFFFISGYLLFLKQNTFLVLMKKKTKSILVPYLLWTVISMLFFFAASSIPFTKSFFSNPLNLVVQFGVLDWIDAFCGHFTQRAPYPMVYQFWFLRDLFILNVLFFQLKFLLNKVPLVLLLTVLFCWIYDVDIYIVRTEALLFFILGFYAVKLNIDLKLIDKFKLYEIILLFTAALLSDYYLRPVMPVVHKFTIIAGCITLLRVSKEIIANKRIYLKTERLAEHTFFVYAFHEPLLTILKKVSTQLMPMHDYWFVFNYFGVVFSCILISLVSGIILKKIFPSGYNLLTGGR